MARGRALHKSGFEKLFEMLKRKFIISRLLNFETPLFLLEVILHNSRQLVLYFLKKANSINAQSVTLLYKSVISMFLLK